MDKELNNLDKRVEEFIENLLTRGSKTPCDETCSSFNFKEEIPPFYDEKLFKKGQKFYRDNEFIIMNSKIFGLISVLSVPTILKILVHTKQTDTEMTAYRRYVATVFHMCIWYDKGFKPGSTAWRSMAEVKSLHNSASKRSCKDGMHRISQKDMALTQLGFMGYVLARSEFFALENTRESHWKAFIHVWRVVGYILGIEDQFNVCKESVEETRLICGKLIDRVFLPGVQKRDPEFLKMSEYLVNGLWCMNPFLNFNVIMSLLDSLLENNNNSEDRRVQKLTGWEKFDFRFIKFVFSISRYWVCRVYLNTNRRVDMWLMKVFPFLAYFKFGIRNAHVRILGKKLQ